MRKGLGILILIVFTFSTYAQKQGAEVSEWSYEVAQKDEMLINTECRAFITMLNADMLPYPVLVVKQPLMLQSENRSLMMNLMVSKESLIGLFFIGDIPCKPFIHQLTITFDDASVIEIPTQNKSRAEGMVKLALTYSLERKFSKKMIEKLTFSNNECSIDFDVQLAQGALLQQMLDCLFENRSNITK